MVKLRYKWDVTIAGRHSWREVQLEDLALNVKHCDTDWHWWITTEGYPAVDLGDNCRTCNAAQAAAEAAIPLARRTVTKLLGMRHPKGAS